MKLIEKLSTDFAKSSGYTSTYDLHRLCEGYEAGFRKCRELAADVALDYSDSGGEVTEGRGIVSRLELLGEGNVK